MPNCIPFSPLPPRYQVPWAADQPDRRPPLPAADSQSQRKDWVPSLLFLLFFVDVFYVIPILLFTSLSVRPLGDPRAASPPDLFIPPILHPSFLAFGDESIVLRHKKRLSDVFCASHRFPPSLLAAYCALIAHLILDHIVRMVPRFRGAPPFQV